MEKKQCLNKSTNLTVKMQIYLLSVYQILQKTKFNIVYLKKYNFKKMPQCLTCSYCSWSLSH